MKNSELTLTEVHAQYFNADALLVSPYRLYRYHHKKDRFYFYAERPRLGENAEVINADAVGTVRIAPGITTVTKHTLPTDEFLIKWIANMGYERAIAYRDERAAYGSFMHTANAQLMIDRQINLNDIDEAAGAYCAKNSLTVDPQNWADDLKQDLLALAAFLRDYNVQPIAVEYSVVSQALGIAATIDLICTLDYEISGHFGEVYASGPNKGQPKMTKQNVRRLAIVDFKSGRESAGSTANKMQLAAQRYILREMQTLEPSTLDAFGGYDEIKLFNWHPKNWQTKPSYTFLEFTDTFNDSDVLNMVNFYHALNKDIEQSTATELSGTVRIDYDGDFTENISTRLIIDIAQEAHANGTAPAYEYETFDSYLTLKLTDDGTQ